MDKLKGWQDAISQITDTTTNTPEPVATPRVTAAWKKFSELGTRSGVDIWMLAAEIESELTTTLLSLPQNPCCCVADSDNGEVAHVCKWHESALQAERERAERYRDERDTTQRVCRQDAEHNANRAEKAEAERDQLRAELAALKEALVLIVKTLSESGYPSKAQWAEIQKTAAHLLKD